MESSSNNNWSPLKLLTSGCDLPWPVEIAALLLRLQWGDAICWRAGISKFPLDQWFAEDVAALGFPLPGFFAWAAAMSEVAGGVLVALGLCTRLSAVSLAFTMGVASFVVHKQAPILDQHIALLYFVGFVFLAISGAGRLSIDGLLRNKPKAGGILAISLFALLAIACSFRIAPEADSGASLDLNEMTSVQLAGSFNDWSLDATPMTLSDEGVWTATVSASEPSPIEFKFVGNAIWDYSAGENDQPGARFPLQGTAEIGAGAANIEGYLPAAGNYLFKLQLPTLEYSVEPLVESETEDAP